MAHLTLLLLLLSALAHGATGAELETWAQTQPTPQRAPATSQGYQFSGPLFTSLARQAARKPGAVRIEQIGRTVSGQPLWAFHVSEPDTPIQRKVLIFAGIHALEWISTEVATSLLHELIEYPPRGVLVTVVPVLNPDGRRRVELDLLAEQIHYRRGNQLLVDLNRDFAVNREAKAIWRHLIPGYYGTSGAPLSQPESQAIAQLAQREHYDRAASLHAFGGYLYFPWAGRWRRPEDWRAYMDLGRAMERAQAGHAYRPRQLSRWGFFFRAQGTEIDHLYGENGTKSFLIELTRSGFDPRHPMRSWRTPFRWYNPTRPKAHIARGVSALRALIRHPSQSEYDDARRKVECCSES